MRTEKITKALNWEAAIALLSLVGISLHLTLRYLIGLTGKLSLLPLAVVLIAGIPLLAAIVKKLFRQEGGADLLAGLSILTAVFMGEYLVGAILVLMISGGAALEQIAIRRASSVLDALARRMPRTAHFKKDSGFVDVQIEEVAAGDVLIVLSGELCPVDGKVVEGRGRMDESYLTGEPFQIAKAPGSKVLSGAINGNDVLIIRAEKPAAESRYANIMRVMKDVERNRPNLRRLGDQLAFWYIPLTLAVAAGAWFSSSDPERLLSVLVVATPCPLLIAIPIAIIGAVSLAASRGIVVKNPAILERIAGCRTMILDKTGTLTFGKPALSEILPFGGYSAEEVLRSAAALEAYSRHPLAAAVVHAAQQAKLVLPLVSEVSEKAGEGLRGKVEGRQIQVVGRGYVSEKVRKTLPPAAPGLECLVLVDENPVALLRFHDAPRPESRPFLSHLLPRHGVAKVMMVSGDRESEVRYLAQEVGISHIAAGMTPEQKLDIVIEENRIAPTLFVGDGINDAPALAAATVGVAIGQNSDITSEAAGAVIMTASLADLDELLHIGVRMRDIALQSAIGGMALSLVGMLLAATGRLTPLEGAVMQELIDLAAILNAVRVTLPSARLADF